MSIPLLSTKRYWVCPNCPTEAVSDDPRPHTKFHECPGLLGLTAPMVPKGTKAKVEAQEREDYIGTEQIRMHEGRPVMSVVTTRDEGQDVAVFAPTATATAKEL